MKNTKKTLLSMVAIILIAAVFATGCEKKNGQKETAPTPNIADAAQTAYTVYVAQKPGHAGGVFLYEANGSVAAIADCAITGTYKTTDEAKAALFGDKAGEYSSKEVAAGLTLLFKADDPYIHAVHESQGVTNTVARAYQLADLQWTPQGGVVPGVVSQSGKFSVISHEDGTTYQGVPYSGTTATDTYLGMNVSLVSFMSALKNPNSVLYTENLHSTNDKAASYYGTVCSKFVQHALDIPGSYNSQNVPKIPNVKTIASAGKYTVDQIKVGDIVVDPQVHTTICTDILYDADGNVAFVEISEAVMPRARRKLWNPEEFYKHFEGYRLCRYEKIADVPAAPEMPTGNETYALMTRFGDKYNFTVSEEKGIVDILEGGYSKAVILRDGEKISEIALNDATKTFEFDRTVPGKLEMYLEKADGTRSGSIYACVVKSSIATVEGRKFASGILTISFEGSSGTPVYVQIGNNQAVFCSIKDAKDNQATIIFPAQGMSLNKTKIRVAYQNEYGIYLSDWTGITID